MTSRRDFILISSAATATELAAGRIANQESALRLNLKMAVENHAETQRRREMDAKW